MQLPALTIIGTKARWGVQVRQVGDRAVVPVGVQHPGFRDALVPFEDFRPELGHMDYRANSYFVPWVSLTEDRAALCAPYGERRKDRFVVLVRVAGPGPVEFEVSSPSWPIRTIRQEVKGVHYVGALVVVPCGGGKRSRIYARSGDVWHRLTCIGNGRFRHESSFDSV